MPSREVASLLSYAYTRSVSLHCKSEMAKDEQLNFLFVCLAQWKPREDIEDFNMTNMVTCVDNWIQSKLIAPAMRSITFAWFANATTRLALSELFIHGKFSVPTNNRVLYKTVIRSHEFDTSVSALIYEQLHADEQWTSSQFLKKLDSLSEPKGQDTIEDDKKQTPQAKYAQKKREPADRNKPLTDMKLIEGQVEYTRISIDKIEDGHQLPITTIIVYDNILTPDELFMQTIAKLQHSSRVFAVQRGPLETLTCSPANTKIASEFALVNTNHTVIERRMRSDGLFSQFKHEDKQPKTFSAAILSKVKTGEVKCIVELTI